MRAFPVLHAERTALLCAVLALAACGGADAGEGERPLPAGTPISIAGTPTVVVGERPTHPDHEFHRVVTPFLLPTGEIAVPLAGDGTIRVFDRRGDLTGTYGSVGEGPGEFLDLGGAWSRGDTIEAFDGRLRRIVRFVPGGPPETIGLDAIGSAQRAAPGSGTGWVLHGVKAVQPTGRDLVAVHRFGFDGAHLAEVAELDGMRRHAFEGGGGPDPFSPRDIVRTRGGTIFVAETLTPRILELDVTTGESRTIEWSAGEAMRVADAERIVRREMEESTMAEDLRVRTGAQLDALVGDERLSSFWDFIVDDAGFIWIRDYDPATHAAALGGLFGPGPGGEWSILAPDGTYLTTVSIPAELEPVAITADEVIGIRRDELDVESVRVYALERTDGSGADSP